MNHRLKASLIFAVAGLSGCGGGSSGEPTFRSFSDAPSDGTYSVGGRLISRPTSSAGGELIDDNEPATIAITNQGGDVVAIRIEGGTTIVDIDDLVVPFESYIALRNATSAVFISDPNTFGTEYTAFAVGYSNIEETSGSVFAGSFGMLTPSGEVLASSASYSGGSVGILVDDAGNPFLTTSVISIATPDFTTATIESTNTALSGGASEPDLDFTSTATVTGNGFEGQFSGRGISGDLSGFFYGPSADEAAGTFTGTGTAGDYIGAFGAN